MTCQCLTGIKGVVSNREKTDRVKVITAGKSYMRSSHKRIS